MGSKKKDEIQDIDRKLGERIAKLRERKGITQKKLAEKLGLQVAQSISAVETGRVSPTVGTLKRISDALGCDLPALFYFDSDTDLSKWLEIRKALRKATPEQKSKALRILSIILEGP